MKKKLYIIIILAFVLNLSALQYKLPKVLFLSTGDGDGRGTISDGLVISNEIFAKLGAVVRIENRKILHNPQKMNEFSIIIAPTIYGYHDGDRRYSLSYLSEIEMQNISNWVKNGGTLVSDVYLGRNRLNGEDRINREGYFNQQNWSMAQCFGVEMKEMNMKNFAITGKEIWHDKIVDKFSKDEWTPVTSKLIGSDIQIIAQWDNSQKQFPALTVNKFYQGNAILLGSFRIIHPAIDNGFSNTEEIRNFYGYVYDLATKNAQHKIKMDVWEKGAKSALCFSFNANGNNEQYENILGFLTQERLPATFMINDAVDDRIVKKIEMNSQFEIASNSYRRIDFRKLNYANSVEEILESESREEQGFVGFRFPFNNNSFWGMAALDELKFEYDSSIGVNHIEFYRGSVFPYNIPIFRENYYQALDLVEISPNFHDDWFYLQALDTKDFSQKQLDFAVAKYDSYLKSMWNRAIKPNNGLMTIVAHPTYSGYNKETLQVLRNAVERAKKAEAWITNLQEVAKRWNQLYDLQIEVTESNKKIELDFKQNNASVIKNLTFTLDKKPQKIEFSKDYSIIKSEDGYLLNLEEVITLDKLEILFQ